jgi:hypothetical protein
MAHPDFEELLAEFNSHRVRYLIGGAHAVALHARPRASKDLDVYLDPTPANASRVLRALTAFFGGTAPQYVTVEALLDPHSILQLGVAPVRVDLLSHFATVTFRKAWAGRKSARFGKVPANFLGLDELIAEKKHWNRPQDAADLAVLRRVPKRPLPSAARRAPSMSRSVKSRKKTGAKGR